MSTLTEVSCRFTAFWRTIRVLALSLSPVLIAAWIIHVEKGYPSHSLSSILEKTEALRASLLSIYDEEELSSAQTYLRAQQAIERAQMLAHRSQPTIAIPYAQSAQALMEQTEKHILRTRFYQFEAKAVALQLELPFNPSSEVETVKVQVVMQDAQVAARQGEWETALNLLERAVSIICTQGLAADNVK